MHLVDEKENVSVLLDLIHKALDAAFELAAELCAGNERSEIQKLDLLLAQLRGDIALSDAQCQALRNGGLADTRLADKAGIVLRSAGEDLHDAFDLTVAPDDRIELAAARLHRQIRAVSRNMLTLGFMKIFLLFSVFPVRLLCGIRTLLHHAVTVCVHAELSQKLRRERDGSAGLEVAVLHVHEARHAVRHGLQLFFGNAHFFHNIIDRLDADLFRANQTVALCRVHVR